MKLFVCSDIHGFYSNFKKSLEASGYNPKSPDHKLIILGDFFDRGQEAKKVKEYLLKTKAILIRGNHDDSLRRLNETGYFKRHDFADGTVDTMKQLADIDSDDSEKILTNFRMENKDLMNLYAKMPYHYVIGDVLFIHSWVPDCSDIVRASRDEWHSATLSNLNRVIKSVKIGEKINFKPYKNVKRVVFGHHRADFIEGMNAYTGPGVNTELIATLEANGLKLYGVDGRVEDTNKIPVLVLEV